MERPLISSTVDVAARLEDPLEKVEFRRVLLADLCDFLTEFSTIPITLDVEALAAAGVAPDEVVAVKMNDTTVGELLSAVLAKHGLVYEIEGQQLLITSSDHRSTALSVMKHDVRELAGPGADDCASTFGTGHPVCLAHELAGRWRRRRHRLWRRDVERQANGGDARKITMFLERLRVVRGLPPRTGQAPNSASPKSKYARAQERLDHKITANYGIETPLSEVLDWMAVLSDTRILIDGVSLCKSVVRRARM